MGNLVAIIGLLRCHLLGYGIIAVIGTGTVSIGDPSGRFVKRSVQTINQYEVNAACIERDIRSILRNYRDHFLPHMRARTHLKSTDVLRNGDWLNAVGFTTFLNEFAPYLRVPEFLEKESVTTRLASGKGMDLGEFLYPALQAMDFAHLHTNYNCLIQIGGQDQLGNIHVGLTLLQRKLGKHAFGLLVPLLTTPDGRKFGKSTTDPSAESTGLWLSKEKLLPFHLFQRILNLPDNMVSDRLLRQLTFLSREEIDGLMMEHKLSPDTRPVQRAIAREVTLLVHGVDAVRSAELATRVLFPKKQFDPAHTESSFQNSSVDVLSNVLSPTERDYLLDCLDPSAGLLPVVHTYLPSSTPSDLGSWLRNVLLSTNKDDDPSSALRLCVQKGVSLNGVILFKPDTTIPTQILPDEHGIFQDSLLSEAITKALSQRSEANGVSVLRIGRHDRWFLVTRQPWANSHYPRIEGV